MAIDEKYVSSPTTSEADEARLVVTKRRVKWYRSTWFNALVLGLCNFMAPGIWGSMNALGGGGEQSPRLVNAANASTFCFMVLTCALSGVFVKYLGIKWTLILGAAGYCPYAAGLYCNNRYGSSWFVLLGAALCGLGAGIFWMAEAAIALAYPEPENQGRFLGFWLSFRIFGQILGGAVNVGLNASRNTAGKVSYSVFQVFIALQALAPVTGLLLSSPSQVQRTDGVTVSCGIPKSQRVFDELKATGRLFLGSKFILVIPLIAQSVFGEAVFFTFIGSWYSVRARALGSLLSGIVALIAGNILGQWLDSKRLSLRTRTRGAFGAIMITSGAWWLWGTIIATRYYRDKPVYDWTSSGFGTGFAWFLFMVLNFQVNYMYLYFVIGNLAESDEEVVRYAGLLRGTESAVQAVSYGLCSIPVMGQVGCIYLNFGLWAIAIVPAWLVIKDFGIGGDKKLAREGRRVATQASDSDAKHALP
ncbi:hypothetical protein B0A48_03039 [Cryoendolithus antarcticus]|uniref:DUF895 domain membrane protein n=1 Tax=Cryoendolithus antarcticus TaxID=1507870 RepID=A0A1V8TLY9_9PEZI|nr:hypothetical protein B0A48_03039 [Cryoendolithus antarcticus]